MEIFKAVGKGDVTPKQAEAMLAAIGSSPDKAVRDMGSMFETMEKFGGNTYRAQQLSAVTSKVKEIASTAAPGWQNAALTQINEGLRTGGLTGPDFIKLRSNVIQDAKRSLDPAALGDWANAARNSGLISRDEFELLTVAP